MDPSPFFELDFDNMKSDDFDILSKFSKDGFDAEQNIHAAEELVYTSSLMKNIKNLFNNPTDDFICFLIKDFNESRITSLVVEKFRPIVKKALTHTIIDIVKEGILHGSFGIGISGQRNNRFLNIPFNKNLFRVGINLQYF